MACATGSSEGFREEEVLHVDDDEGGFGGVDGDGDGGGLDGEFGVWDGGCWGCWVREVEAAGRVVEPEVGRLADERLARWCLWFWDSTHADVIDVGEGSLKTRR